MGYPLRKHSLYVKLSRCNFRGKQVEYFGYVVTRSEILTEPIEVEAMRNWSLPTSVKQLHGFLGLTGYYRKFIKDYGSISRPLTDILKKDSFQRSEGVEKAFKEFNVAMTNA